MCDEETSRHAWHRIGSYDMPSDEDEIVGRGWMRRKGYQGASGRWEGGPRRWASHTLGLPRRFATRTDDSFSIIFVIPAQVGIQLS